MQDQETAAAETSKILNEALDDVINDIMKLDIKYALSKLETLKSAV